MPVKTLKNPEGIWYWWADPKEPDLDWNEIEPFGTQDGWEKLKREFAKTYEGRDKCGYTEEFYLYVRCVCGDVWFIQADKLDEMKDCGCGRFKKPRKNAYAPAPESYVKPTLNLAPREVPKRVLENAPAGRPKLYDGERSKVVSFTIPESMHEWLEKLYWETRASKSGVVTQALREYRERLESGSNRARGK